MRDTHVVIVDHHRQHIDWRAIRAQNDHVVQLIVANFDVALNLVLDCRHTLARCFYPYCERCIRVLVFRDVAPRRTEQG